MDVLESISPESPEEMPRPFKQAGKWEDLTTAISEMSQYFGNDGALSPEEWERKNDRDKARKGVEVIIRQENEILLDLDDLESIDRAYYLSEILEAAGLIKSIDEWPSKSAVKGDFLTNPSQYRVSYNKLHWRITTNMAMTPDEAIFFQTLMGSDPQRELLNFLGHKAGIKEPSKLYKYPEKI